MAARGWTVIATCRKPEDLAARAAEGMIALPLDLADHASVEAAVDAALEHGPVDALVNNAAFALPGAVEDLPRDGLRAKERLADELSLADAGGDAILDAMAAHPILINRPLVETAKGVRLCRPQDVVREIL